MLSIWLFASVVTLSAGPSSLDQETRPTPQITIPADGEIQELTLKDGSRAYGRVERIDGERVVFVTTAKATIEVERQQILSLRRAEGRTVRGDFWRADPNPTRLFFAPTARSLKKGEGYFGVYEILLPFVQVGITNSFSVGAGTPLVFGLGNDHPFWVTPKFQFYQAPSTQAAIGVLHFMNVGDGNLGIAYGVVTQGSADSALTAGLGYAYERSYGESEGSALVMVGGEHRVRRSMKVITENYFWRDGGFASVGARWFGERLAADLALVVPIGADELVAFPLVNFVWSFSR